MGRALTALVGIPVLIVAIWFGAPWLPILVAFAMLIGLREYSRMTSLPKSGAMPWLAALWGLMIVISAQFANQWSDYLPHAVLGGGVLLAAPWLLANFKVKGALSRWSYWVFGPFYVAFLLSHTLLIREIDGPPDLGKNWLFFVLVVVFATDTGAFFTGRLMGRRRMAPSISPGKTWEGAVGGFLWATGFALLLNAIFELWVPVWQTVMVGAVIGVVAQIGDLLESRLKRASRVKDAGSLLPGHGGVLDRIDSIVLAVPTVYYLVKFVLGPSG